MLGGCNTYDDALPGGAELADTGMKGDSTTDRAFDAAGTIDVVTNGRDGEASSEASVIPVDSEADADAKADALALQDAGGGDVDATPSWDAPVDVNGCTTPNRKTETPISSVISDFENGNFIQAFSPGAAWFDLNDGTAGGVEMPSPFAISTITPARGTSLHGVHTTGTGFTGWGGGVGFTFVQGNAPADLSQYKGVSFFGKWTGGGSPQIRVTVVTTGTFPDYCTCLAGQCNDHHGKFFVLTSSWAQYSLTWSELTQAGFGFPVAFDPKTTLGMNFLRAVNEDWDFWIDDVELVP
jgi:hypothetical protein